MSVSLSRSKDSTFNVNFRGDFIIIEFVSLDIDMEYALLHDSHVHTRQTEQLFSRHLFPPCGIQIHLYPVRSYGQN